jgi:hypothetical protein
MVTNLGLLTIKFVISMIYSVKLEIAGCAQLDLIAARPTAQ